MKKSNLKRFQELLINENIDLYLVPTSDYHNSEYIGDYFKTREYLTNFTGSAGTLLISKDNAYLFVDGRYFVQVEKEVNKEEITIMKIGQPGVPNISDFIASYLHNNQTFAFDGKVINYNTIKVIKEKLCDKNITIISDIDLVNKIWKDRPSLPLLPLFSIEEYAGCSALDKINKIKEEITINKCDTHIITSLDDIAYILNLRGHDIINNPVFLSYLIISNDKVILYINKEKLREDIISYLNVNNIEIKDYFAFYEDIKKLNNKNILLDSSVVNYLTYSLLSNNKIIDKPNPSSLMKCIKNDMEINNLRQCHILDGLAMLNTMIFIKNIKNYDEIFDEYEIGKIVDYNRSLQPYFIENSFNPIVAFKENAAIVHYSAKKDKCKKIKGNGLLLIDSGGQYYLGTTDITRTFVIGKVNKQVKRHFTLVLKAMFNLTNAKFIKGTSGTTLDAIARNTLWNENLNYNHGTGHGVGYCLNVHEGPNNFRYNSPFNPQILEGMTTSNEPGLYIENSHGIRHENIILTIKDSNNEFGEFLKFETLTLCPFDLDGLDLSLLTKQDKKYINEYHEYVYNKLSPYCDEEQLNYLNKFTRKI